MKFVRIFTEYLLDAFAELQFGFGSGGVAIRKAILTEVIDGGEYFVKPCRAVCNVLRGNDFRRWPLVLCSSYSCHDGVWEV